MKVVLNGEEVSVLRIQQTVDASTKRKKTVFNFDKMDILEATTKITSHGAGNDFTVQLENGGTTVLPGYNEVGVAVRNVTDSGDVTSVEVFTN